MKYKDLYGNCKTLASYNGYYADDKHATYIDPFGCDLQIFYTKKYYPGINATRESIITFLGGREVYCFSEDASDCERIVEGHWEKLIPALCAYQFDLSIGGEIRTVNSTLIELCQKESARNRETLDKYYKVGKALAKKGEQKSIGSKKTVYYYFEKKVDGHVISSRWSPNGVAGDVALTFDEKKVFVFYAKRGVVGGRFDNKGRYATGEWEEYFDNLAEQ